MRTRLLLLGLVLLLAIPLVLVLGDFARKAIAVPLLYILWIGRLLLNSIPQLPFWALLLAVALVVAGASLVGRKKPKRKASKEETDYEGRVRVLTRWIHHAAEGGDYSKWRLAQCLGQLTQEGLACRGRLDPEQVKDHLQSGEVNAPPEIQAYLQAGLAPMSYRPAGLFSRLSHRLRLSAQTFPIDLDPERAVQFLEDQLENVI